jgi:hypothetical protein
MQHHPTVQAELDNIETLRRIGMPTAGLTRSLCLRHVELMTPREAKELCDQAERNDRVWSYQVTKSLVEKIYGDAPAEEVAKLPKVLQDLLEKRRAVTARESVSIKP